MGIIVYIHVYETMVTYSDVLSLFGYKNLITLLFHFWCMVRESCE